MLSKLKVALASLALVCTLATAVSAQTVTYPADENIPSTSSPTMGTTVLPSGEVGSSVYSTTNVQSQGISPNASILANSVFQQKLAALNQQEMDALRPILDKYYGQISSILNYNQFKTFRGMRVGHDPIRLVTMLQTDEDGVFAFLSKRLDLTGSQEEELRPILRHLVLEAGPICNQFAQQEQQLVAVNQEPPVAITTTSTTTTSTTPTSQVESTTTTPPTVTTPSESTPKKQVKGTQTNRRFIRNRSMK